MLTMNYASDFKPCDVQKPYRAPTSLTLFQQSTGNSRKAGPPFVDSNIYVSRSTMSTSQTSWNTFPGAMPSFTKVWGIGATNLPPPMPYSNMPPTNLAKVGCSFIGRLWYLLSFLLPMPVLLPSCQCQSAWILPCMPGSVLVICGMIQ